MFLKVNKNNSVFRKIVFQYLVKQYTSDWKYKYSEDPQHDHLAHLDRVIGKCFHLEWKLGNVVLSHLWWMQIVLKEWFYDNDRAHNVS